MLEFIIKYWWQIILVFTLLIIFIVSIVYRKQLKKKIEKEVISFTAMLISLGFAFVGFITKSQTETVPLATIGGREVSLFFPIFWIFIVIFVIVLVYFFREELKKEI